jgi:hypothetical protein
MIVRDATRIDIETVVRAMRAEDAREVYAARFTDDPEHLIDELDEGRKYCLGFLALCAGEFDPIGLLGARLRSPNVASVAMIATDRWPEIAFAATRFSIRYAIPAYLGSNVHRAQCECWEGNEVSKKWLEALGFTVEGTLRALGKNGEDFIQYSWLNPKRLIRA